MDPKFCFKKGSGSWELMCFSQCPIKMPKNIQGGKTKTKTKPNNNKN